PSDVPCDFAAAGRVTHHGDLFEVQRLDDRGEIVGIPVHVVSGPRLAGSAVAATIVRHDSETFLCEEQHLSVPHVGVQRPSVREGNDRTRAPVFVIDRGAVFHRDRAHAPASCIGQDRAARGDVTAVRCHKTSASPVSTGNVGTEHPMSLLTPTRLESPVAVRRKAFRALHEQGCFVIPNPWDVGSARYLQRLGFPARATTSAGFAFSQGLPDSGDGGGLARDSNLAYIASIASAVDLPVSADFMSGYGAEPEDVAESVARCVATGVAGLSIEDSTDDP